MAKTILVTGATGTVGSQVLAEFRNKPDVQIRAAVRNLGKAPQGVEPVLFDYAKPETFGPACRGVDAVFMVAPFGPEGIPPSTAFLAAAKSAGVKHIVKLSVAAHIGDIALRRWHSAIDSALKNSGITWTLLCPGAFMQNFVESSSPQPDGGIYVPMGNGRVAFIDTRDIAAVAAKALTEPGHNGKEYTLTGPELLTYSDAASIIGEAAGRPVRFIDIPESTARQGLQSAHVPGVFVDALMELYARAKADRTAEVTTTVSDVLGRPARSFREFARDYADSWKK